MVSFGTALSGYGLAQPQLQQMQQGQQQKGQQAAIIQALQQYAGQRPQGGGLPQQAATMPGGAPSPNTQAPPTQNNSFGGGLPPLDQIIASLSKSGLSPDQQYEALQKYGAFASPIEKYTQQLNMASEKMDMTRQMLDEKMKNAVLLQQMRGDTSSSNTHARIGAQERGQDVRADTAAGAQDIARQRADTYEQGTSGKLLQGEEGLKIRQQNADTGSAREKAGEKFQQEKIDLSTKSLKEKNDLIMRGQNKQYQAKLASIAARGTPAQQAQFKAAQTEFTQASAAYRNEKMAMNGTGDIKALADKAANAQQKMESTAASIGGSGKSGEIPLVNTQEEYDKLPAGAQYKEPDGNTYLKP